MSNHWIVVDEMIGDKKCARVIQVSSYDNILYKIKLNHTVFACIADTKKQAEGTANSWNETHKKNGIYLYG